MLKCYFCLIWCVIQSTSSAQTQRPALTQITRSQKPEYLTNRECINRENVFVHITNKSDSPTLLPAQSDFSIIRNGERRSCFSYYPADLLYENVQLLTMKQIRIILHWGFYTTTTIEDEIGERKQKKKQSKELSGCLQPPSSTAQNYRH